MPEALGSFYTSWFYSWDSLSMRAVRTSASPKLASFVDPHSSFAADVESSPEDVVEVPFDDYVTKRKVAVRLSNPQSYRREELRLTIFQVGEV